MKVLRIPEYTQNRGVDIGKSNIEKLKKGEGTLSFTGAYIHLTPECNFNCMGCYTKAKLSKKRLTFEQVKGVVDFAKDRGAKLIIFAGAGEPLLDPEFEKICDYVQGKGLKILLFTNATQIKNIGHAKKLLSYGHVIVKLVSLNPKMFDKFVGKEAFNESMKGLKLLIKAKEELGLKTSSVLGVDCFITQENKEDVKDVLRFCRKNKLFPYLDSFIEFRQDKKDKKLALTEEELTKLFLKLQQIDKKEFNINTTIKSCSRVYGEDPCFKSTHMFEANNDGDIFMCICTDDKIGSVFDCEDPYQSLEKIFNTKNKKLINYFKCNKCSARVNKDFL